MTCPNKTHLCLVLDASGSMSKLSSDTIGSFNSFLADQKALPDEATFTLCTFNDDATLVHHFEKLASVPNLTTKTYKPNGSTALLDAMGSTIDSVGEKLAAMSEDERPSKVLFMVITDGEENVSTQFTKAQVKEMIDHQTEKYSWDFVFLGASLDQIAEGQSLGVSQQNSMQYVPTSAGTKKLYRAISESTISYRSSGGATRSGGFFGDSSTDSTTNQK
jgi:uncharacterized protein YegL